MPQVQCPHCKNFKVEVSSSESCFSIIAGLSIVGLFLAWLVTNGSPVDIRVLGINVTQFILFGIGLILVIAYFNFKKITRRCVICGYEW